MEVINFLIFIVISSFFYSTAAQEPCGVGFKQCSPAGASRREVPVIGPDLARFYLELVYTVRIVSGNGHAVEGMAFARQTDPGDSLCCAENSACEMIRSFRIAFCWDRFTTSYFLPDGSYGSASNGSYTTPQGDTANLISGEYHMGDGTVGNIYDESPADKPEPGDLPLPTPFTSSGVGSAIPASQLGAQLSQTSTALSSSASLTSTLATSSSSLAVTEGVSTSTLTSTSSSSLVTSFPSDSVLAPTTTTEASATTSTGSITPGPTSSSPTTTLSSTSSSTSAAIIPSGNETNFSSGTIGNPSASSTNVNGSWPIFPPINNLAAATVVYCMAAKVLVWLVFTVII